MASVVVNSQQDGFPASGGGLQSRGQLSWFPGSDARIIETGGDKNSRILGPIFDVMVAAHFEQGLETVGFLYRPK